MQNIPGYYQYNERYYKIDQRRNRNDILAREVKAQDEQRLKMRKHRNYVKLLESRSSGTLTYPALKKNVTEEFLKNVEVNNPEFTVHDIPINRPIHHLCKTNENSIYMYCQTERDDHILYALRKNSAEIDENGLNIHCEELFHIRGKLNDFQFVENEDSTYLITSSRQRNQLNRLELFLVLPNIVIIPEFNPFRNCSKVKFIRENDEFRLFIADKKELRLETVSSRTTSKLLQSKIYSNVITSIDYNKNSLPCVGFEEGYVVMKDRRMPFSSEAAEFYGGGPNIIKVKNFEDTDYIVCEAVENRHVVSLFDVRNTSIPVFEYLNVRNAFAEKIPFVLDSTESMISLDCRLMRNAGPEFTVRIFDVQKGNIIAAYPGFQQLMYEERWPSINKLEGLVGFQNSDLNRVVWLPMSNNL